MIPILDGETPADLNKEDPLKKINLLMVTNLLNRAVKCVTKRCISRCFTRCGFIFGGEHGGAGSMLNEDENTGGFSDFDDAANDCLFPTEEATAEVLERMVEEAQPKQDDSGEEDEEHNDTKGPTMSEALPVYGQSSRIRHQSGRY